MCATCGCGEHDHKHHRHENDHLDNDQEKLVLLEKDVLHKNQLIAERNRGFFEARNIKAINLLSSPGSGKTTLLEKTIKNTNNQYRFYVVEGDQQSCRDAERIEKSGAKAFQVNTGKGCHLDANMVHRALHELQLENDAFLIIENVGNLVCPAMFDLGEHKRAVIMSVTEGEDKPLKYPDIFCSADVCLINKIDLLPYLDFDITEAEDYLHRVNPNMEILRLSTKTEEGMEGWYHWLEREKLKLLV
ncbi:MAG: hydrogenase nickel incorporation protein HypB [Bacteroidota bacterium]